jgi:hypothetical protein
MPVDVHGNLNRAVPHLVSHVRARGPGLNQQTAKCVAEVVKANPSESRAGEYLCQNARIENYVRAITKKRGARE